ncbi:uncharacterized protein K460DRAFT_405988 [Cucurbitaria berberidis CBS 394.84]|uniref:Uncharacterized protein n=1 Tax=Cucurbitaria berberidis CBS 394.84 TaxID=1168544 RepID=A0A9P4GGM7_9PLEO|nr:uncharacterized protein K460DRAFT_405988 [Cucurbitaria berberidis CBS 394.84]KAF1845748.1 hypothetical protein K460DRAFT_405988 [Cucurbitaria berberidis CBS 394.84]
MRTTLTEAEDKLSRGITIITTPHAHECLTSKGDDSFKNVYALDLWVWDNLVLDVDAAEKTSSIGAKPSIKITDMPRKHIPPGPLCIANDLLRAVPPTNS